MSRIRFIINQELQARKDNAANRLIRNLANLGLQAAGTEAVSLAKKVVYDLLLPGALLGSTGDSFLSTSFSISPYKASDNRVPVRNNLLIESNDKSLSVEILDVKIDVSFENTIIKTPVTKRRGTIKEYICAKDYSFNVSGSLIADSQFAFPINELQEFIKIFKIEENFSVTNVLINSFDVHKLVLESGSVPQSNSKYANAVNFNLRMLSDEDVELSIEEEG